MKKFTSNKVSSTRRGETIIPYSDNINVLLLTNNAQKRILVPPNAQVVLFSSNGDFWAAYGDESVSATIPTGDITNGTAGDFNPLGREVVPGTYISLIATANTIVTLAFYGA